MLSNGNSIGLYTDHYELTMAQGYFLTGKHLQTACFDYFFRTLPYDGGFVTYAGLSSVLALLKDFRFSDDDCYFLKNIGFKDNFLNYLRDFSFKATVTSAREGEIIFPNEPILRVEGNIIEAQLVETLFLNFLNFESLIATKASRMRYAAGDRLLLEFGLRRSQGFGGIHATKASISGGFDKTSNDYAAKLFDISVSGTMAHSWILSFPDELTSFRAYAELYPDECVLLVDTYDTIGSGIPNAITVAKELKNKGHNLLGVRLDSGDLAYLSRKSRKMMDDAGLQEVKIVASNQLDEDIILSLLLQNAPIDIFGVGTSLVTGKPDAALDGVYKLSHFDGNDKLKVSENLGKMTLPGIKTIHRFINDDNEFEADGISFVTENDYNTIHHPIEHKKSKNISRYKKEELLIPVMDNGILLYEQPKPDEIAAYNKERLQQLPPEHKRFLNPHVYIVGISDQVLNTRNQLAKSILGHDLF